MRKRKPRINLKGVETKHGVVIDSNKPGLWDMLCNHCGLVHEMEARAIRKNSFPRSCLQFKPHNYKGIERRDGIIRRQYGITQKEYDTMLESQNFVCAICNRSDEVEGRALAIDHDHSTGRVRGLLCGPCNRGLGLFQDDAARMFSAIKYLKE